jgi:hypothetical protein
VEHLTGHCDSNQLPTVNGPIIRLPAAVEEDFDSEDSCHAGEPTLARDLLTRDFLDRRPSCSDGTTPSSQAITANGQHSE